MLKVFLRGEEVRTVYTCTPGTVTDLHFDWNPSEEYIWYTVILSKDSDVLYMEVNMTREAEGEVLVPYSEDLCSLPSGKYQAVLYGHKLSIKHKRTPTIDLMEKLSHKLYTKNFSIKRDPVTDRQRKYCSCVLKVASKQSDECLYKKMGKKCYNPYAVCAKSVGTTYRHCRDTYSEDMFSKLSDEELKAYSKLSMVSIPVPYNREKLIENILEWKALKYGI